ncbi:MAG: hypothetical protein LBN27_05085 [Prevotellaceae bacterium]|jgi:hypothetical protein|nr:hypothetical protein [Prevotellaceae bacterium]
MRLFQFSAEFHHPNGEVFEKEDTLVNVTGGGSALLSDEVLIDGVPTLTEPQWKGIATVEVLFRGVSIYTQNIIQPIDNDMPVMSQMYDWAKMLTVGGNALFLDITDTDYPAFEFGQPGTAMPKPVGVTAGVGSSEKWAREDHTHALGEEFAATTTPAPVANVSFVGYSDKFARADHVHKNPRLQSYQSINPDNEQTEEHSVVRWGDYEGQNTMRFHGYGFDSGSPENPTELEYVWGDHFHHKFERAGRNYKTNRYERFNDDSLSLYFGSPESGWESGADDGLRVFYADRDTLELAHGNTTTNDRHVVLSSGRNPANTEYYTILHGVPTDTIDDKYPNAKALPLLRVGDKSGYSYSGLYNANGYPLLLSGNAAENILDSTSIAIFDGYGTASSNIIIKYGSYSGLQTKQISQDL